MARASSKKSVTVKVAKVKSSSSTRSRSGSKRNANDRLEQIDLLFESYASNLPGLIDPEGIEALCSDLGVSHTDVRVLMLAWKMGANKQGYFTQEEWRKGLEALGADTLAKLKNALPQLEGEVRSPDAFAEFYSYSFNYCLTEEKQKHVDVETCCILLDIVLGLHCRSQVDLFVEYLKVQKDYRVITMDQWMGFLRFCKEVLPARLLL